MRWLATIPIWIGLLAFASCRTPTLARCPAIPGGASPRFPARRSAAPPILIRGATVWTANGAVLPRADLLVRDGRIAALGALSPSAGVTVIDGQGKHLTPGLIDPHGHLGVYPVPYLTGSSDGNEVARPVSASARAADALWPQDPAIPRALAAGVTAALVVPGSANLIGGEGITIRLLPGRSAAELRFPGAPATLKLACGENPKRTYGEKGGPHTRMGSLARVRELLGQAVEYRRRWQKHREKLAEWRASGCRRPLAGGAGGEPEAPKRDLALDTIVRVLEGEIQVHWHCYRADEMLLLLELAREHGFQIRAFHHATEAYKVRRELARAGTGAVVWINWWGFKAEALDAIPENAALLLEAGALAALHTDSPVVIQRFVQEAAQALYRGRDAGLSISEDQALRLVTANPARLLGIEREVGTIELGKRGDLVLWDGHPFSVYTRVDRVLVDGREVYQRRRGTRATDLELGLVPGATPLEPAPVAASTPPALGASWLAAPLARPVPAPGQGPTLAVLGARLVHTMTGDPEPGAVVLLRGGRVVEVGPRVAIPADAVRIDAGGGVVTPGLIAADSALGLVEINLERSASEGSPRGPELRSVRASLRVADALNPGGVPIATALAAGFTTAIVRSQGGLISGQGAAFDLHGSLRAPDLVAPVAQHAWLGLAATRSLGSRAIALARLRALLEDARTLTRSRAAIDANRYRRLSAPLRELEALAPVVERRQPLVLHVHRAADILAALRLGEEQQIRLVLSGAAEAWRVAPEIARARVPVLVEVDRNLPESFDSLGARYDNAARLDRAGVVIALSAAGDAHDLRLLRQLAGIAAAWGLPRDRALRALTAAPAEIFGLRDRGVLTPGARANLVVWSGDPLELATHPRAVVVGGQLAPPVSRQTLLRDRYR